MDVPASAGPTSLALELHPPELEDQGLQAALDWLAGRMQSRYCLAVELTIDETVGEPDPPIAAFLFDAARELLFNVLKHSGTDRAALALRAEGEAVELRVRDEGHGMIGGARSADSLGLLRIEERVNLLDGRLAVESAEEAGTEVTLHVPLRRRAA